MACLSGISCMRLIVSIFGLIVNADYADCASCCKGWMTVDRKPSNFGRCTPFLYYNTLLVPGRIGRS